MYLDLLGKLKLRSRFDDLRASILSHFDASEGTPLLR